MLPLFLALWYHFSSVVTGVHPSQITGRAVADGAHCRIDFDPDPKNVRERTYILCGDNGEHIAVNSANKTWYRLKSRTRIAASSPLFFYLGATVSKMKVTSDPDNRVRFSYQLEFKAGGETVTGDVWGEIKVSPADPSHKGALPWNPADISTGYPAVDDGLHRVLSAFGTVEKTEMTVSRRIADGETMTQTITRRIEWTDAPAPKVSFAVPSDYKYQEPVLGVPGGR